MPGARFVVLGLAQARSAWFRSVAQWANSASIPVEFVKCMSQVELRAHLASGRAFSALLVDGGLPGIDRDLLDEARTAGCAVLVVDDLRVTRDWRSLGASAVVNPMFERKHLIDLLAEHTVKINRGDSLVPLPDETSPALARGHLAAVCGPGGTGASTAAIGLAQALASARSGRVLLADFALHAEQAMLHDARDVVPGVQELVDAHRAARPPLEELCKFTFAVQSRGYDLLLGLRRARNWPAIRPRAFVVALESLTLAWSDVVCDVDADFEGEDDGGSVDVEERHLMARVAVGRADVVFAVGLGSMKGIHALDRVLGDLLDHGVSPERVVTVINRAPKNPRIRAGISSALSQLVHGRTPVPLMTPIYLPERRVDEALRDGVRLPPALTSPLAGAFRAVIGRMAEPPPGPVPQPIQPGSLGHWSADVSPEPA